MAGGCMEGSDEDVGKGNTIWLGFSTDYRIPESRRAFWRIVSLTAAKTSRIWRCVSGTPSQDLEHVRWTYR